MTFNGPREQCSDTVITMLTCKESESKRYVKRGERVMSLWVCAALLVTAPLLAGFIPLISTWICDVSWERCPSRPHRAGPGGVGDSLLQQPQAERESVGVTSLQRRVPAPSTLASPVLSQV